MSFSSEVKEKLCECKPKCGGCVFAELAGLLRFGGRDVRGAVHFTTENEKIAKRLSRDIFECCETDVGYTENSRSIQFIIDPETAGEIRDFKTEGAKRCCKSAYVRGAFLGAGSVNDPKRSYHLEMSTRNREELKKLCEVLSNGGIAVKVTERKGVYVAYVKDCEMIADTLALMGGTGAALDMFSIQVEKAMRNGINRRVNCETANTDKLITASSRHIAAIRKIKNSGGWSKLPDTLKEIGELRIEYPDIGLKELGEKTEPPITKSGVNHRLNRILRIADEI